MKTIIKTLSCMGLIMAVCGANAATSRVGMKTTATPRLPSIAGYMSGASSATTAGTSSTVATTTTTASLLSNAECIESYTGCLKGSDTCGPNFEECTTNVLLHAQMPKCLSVLAQCSASGINDLFGTTSTTALAEEETKNSYGEVTKYRYPKDGAVLGQMVTGAQISNRYDTQQCVKRYQNCLKKDTVCGNDFELCTSSTEFKKQSIYCASTLARCQSDGLIELFGSTNTSAAPSGSSRLGTAISEGAALAAVNAVSTCYKIADQCILNACGSNPYKCMADTSGVLAKIAEGINEGKTITADQLTTITSMTTNADVSGYVKNMCLDTIGSNKYCYATFIGNGAMPTNSQLRDEDNKDEIFSEAFSSRMNAAMKQKVQDLMNKFDTKAKDKCLETVKTCAMRSCGSGVGSVCYSLVFGATGEKSINGKATYEDIKTACEAVVNADSNCQYAAASANNNMYTYTYTDNSVFGTLFPQYEAGGSDPIGAVAALNASLSTTYNDAAIAQMKKQCANTAISCVKSMCGTDYVNCYRNRTDVKSDTYNTGAAGFDKSMNKVGGVLDYTIVTGLCINTVKNADVCEEHLKIEAVKLKADAAPSWGGSVRGDWLTAASSISATATPVEVTMGCRVKEDTDKCSRTVIEACGTVDEDGCLYDEEVTQTWTEYSLSQSANNLFQEVLMDIEKEAQAKYNAKLTKEQNICLSNNNGGIMGASDNGSTFMWVKLKSNKVPKNYAMKGLTTNQFIASNDLYGSFCRARITVQSDDKAIQDALGDKAIAYFAVGDAFTCGSWIDQSTLDNITKKVGEKARKEAGEGSVKEKLTYAWSTIGGALGGGALGFFGMDALQKNGGSLGGLLDGKGIKQTKSNNYSAGECAGAVDAAREYNNRALNSGSDENARNTYFTQAVNKANQARNAARKAGANVAGIEFTTFGGFTTTQTTSTTGYDYITTYLDDARTDLESAYSAIDACGLADGKAKATNNLTNARTALDRAKRDRETMDSQKPTSVSDDALAKTVLSYLTTAKSELTTANASCATSYPNLATIVIPASVTITATTTTNKVAGSGQQVTDFNAAEQKFVDNLSKLENICYDVVKQEDENAQKKRRNNNLIAGGVLTAVGGALGAGISASVLKAKYEKAENEAIAKWMEEVGSHIQCYLGAEELGSYGDLVTFEIE